MLVKNITKPLSAILVLIYIFTFSGVSSSVFAAERFTEGSYKYEIQEDNSVRIVSYKGTEETVIIPSEFKGKTVKTIGMDAFLNTHSMKKLVIPDTVEKLEHNAFTGCSNLSDVTLSKNLKKMYYSFNDCKSLTSIFLPKSLSDGYDSKSDSRSKTFLGTPLKNVTIEEGSKIVLPYLLYDNKTIEKIVLPESIEEIEEYAFFGCTSLKEIKLPNSLKKIHRQAFDECKSLTYIKIPKTLVPTTGYSFPIFGKSGITNIDLELGIKEIPDSFYRDIKNLKEIVIPSSVTTINNSALYGCDALTTIKLTDSVQKVFGGYPTSPSNLKYIHLEGKLGNSSNIGPIISAGYNNLSEIPLVSSNEKVATIDKKSGKISLVGVGTTVIMDGKTEASSKKVIYVKVTNNKINDIKKCKATLTKSSFVYINDKVTPRVRIKDSNKELVNGVDFTVECKNNKNVGVAEAVVTGIGNYSGSISLKFNITPVPPTIENLTSKNGVLNAYWNKITNASGYEIVYSTKKSSGFSKPISIKDTKVKINGKKNLHYYVKVRSYQTVAGKKLVSSYSAVEYI